MTAEAAPFRIEASAAECARLARWLTVDDVVRVTAEGTVALRPDGHDIAVSGHIDAEVVQTCVVSLQPLHRHLDVAFERLFSATLRDEWSMYEASDEAIFVDLEGDLVAEPLPPAGIDLGAVVAEELSLHIDPYPRSSSLPSAGEAAEGTAGDDARRTGDGDEPIRPFADLAERLSKR